MYEFKKSSEGTKPVDMLTDMFISQIDEAAAPYQMISTMAHGVVFDCDKHEQFIVATMSYLYSNSLVQPCMIYTLRNCNSVHLIIYHFVILGEDWPNGSSAPTRITAKYLLRR
jgi:hypothetical protein